MNKGNRKSLVDLNTVFEPASWLIKIEFINQFILHNNVLISVLGESGSGKTTFAELLQEKCDSTILTEMISIVPLFDQAQFINRLCESLVIEDASSIAEIAQITNKRQSRVLILIDNAELLPESFLKELLETLQQQPEETYFHVCLLSDFSLVKMTSRLARETYQDMIHSIELQPLSETETKEYVLLLMGLTSEEYTDFPATMFHQFYRLTEGNLALINTQMRGFFSSTPKEGNNLHQAITYGAVSLVTLAVLGLGFWFYIKTSNMPIEPEQFVENNIQAIEIDLPLLSKIPGYAVASIHEPMQIISLQKAEIQLAQLDENEEEAKFNESMVVMDKVIPIPKVVMPSTIKPAVVAKVKSAPAKKLKIKAQPPQFTIQLIASKNHDVLVRLSRQLTLSKLKIRHFNHQGETWYVLTTGEYVQQEQAKKAVENLPKQLAELKPWVRSMVNLQG